MKIYKTLFLYSCFLFSPLLNAQEWVEKMKDPSENFYEVKKAFEELNKDQEYERGKGMKQYWRWENFMEPRVYPTGERFSPAAAFLETKKFERENKQTLINNKAANWQPMGPTSLVVTSASPGLGRVNAVAVDPNDSATIYIGTPAGGLWKTTNFGQNWYPLTDGLPVLGVSGIAIDPNNSNIVYICTGDGDGSDTYSIGVLKSTDGGQTFQPTGFINTLSQFRTCRKIMIDPSNSAKLYLATSNGLFTTQDSGSTWNLKANGSFWDIEFQPGNSNKIYACTDEFYISSDSGNTFTKVTNGLPSSGSVNRMSIAVTEDDSTFVYGLYGNQNNSSFYGLYRSVNAGQSFSLRSNSPNILGWTISGNDNGGQSWYDLALAVSPFDKDEVMVGGINVWKSTNGGSNWNISSHWVLTPGIGYTHADIHILEYFGNDLFCGSDGGLYHSTNNGNSWYDLSVGLQISQFYRIASSEEHPNRILTGAQDNGISVKKSGVWHYIHGGDGMNVEIDPFNPNYLYYSTQNGGINRSMDGGQTSTDIGSTIRLTENGAWITPYVLDQKNPSTIYAGFQNVWRSDDRGSTWNKISNFNSNATLRTLTVAPSNSNYIYTCSNNPYIKRTTDGGNTWTSISSNLYNAAITSITVHPKDPDIVWVTMSGYANGNKVFKTINGGGNWTNISYNLPNLPANTLVYDEYADGLYVGTDVGVYYMDSTTNNWVQYMTGLPNVIINELEIIRRVGKLRAGTYGRGVWESDLYKIPNKAVAKYITDQTSVCPGGSIQFRDRSFNDIDSLIWIFQGGVPATSTAKNPFVTYPTAGYFDVTLMVSDGIAWDTLVVDSAIYIGGYTDRNLPESEDFQTKNFFQTHVDWNVVDVNPTHPDNQKWSQQEYQPGEYAIFINNYQTDIRNHIDQLVTPAFNITNFTTPQLEFDVAHRTYGVAPYIDTLRVLYSSDCGQNVGEIYKKWGNGLATVPGNFSPFYIPVTNEFRTETISLNNIIGKDAVSFVFDNISGFGNNIYVDNIKIKDQATGFEEVIYSSEYSVSPNPFIEAITVKWNSEELTPSHIKVYNGHGKEVFIERDINHFQHTINLESVPSGIYLMEIYNKNKRSVIKLIKSK